MTPSETETLKMFDEQNVKAGDIHVRLSNAITHAQLAMGEDEMRETRTEVFDAVKEILLTQIRLARADERKQAYEDGKNEGMKEMCEQVAQSSFQAGHEDGRNAVVDYMFKKMDFDGIMHNLGKCSFPMTSTCAAEEHKIKNLLYEACNLNT